jgi:hypothetical protein
MSAPDVTGSLQAALAGENACVYAYGLAGALLSGAGARSALAAIDAHRVRRDAIAARLVAASAAPTPAAAAYDPPFPVVDAASARRLAGTVEARLALVWSDVVAAAAGAHDPVLLATAAAAVQEASVRAAGWTGSTTAFPGVGGTSSK